MKIGVDFGTTRIVVAAVDRGNYPLVGFDAPDGQTRDWFPPVVAVRGHERRYGFEAWLSQEQPGWTVVRSVKRLLAEAGLDSQLEIGGQLISIQTLLREMASAMAQSLREGSTLSLKAGEPLDVMLGVPANSNSNQRFLTAEGFRQAGFHVIGVLNEPSAASIEFGHRLRTAGDAMKRRLLLVYDFGGGTFDASLVEMDEQVHHVIDSEGVSAIGGDDLDELLADLALDAAGVPQADRDAMGQDAVFRLLELCREQKEALHPNTRRIVIDLERVNSELSAATVKATEFYDRCVPMVDRTIDAVDRLLERQGVRPDIDSGRRLDGESGRRLDVVYAIGGASDLPLVGRRLRERYGRLVRKSSYGRSSTAIGLAIQADAEAGYVLRDRFTRYFGVWREGDAGKTAVFDPLFARGTALPGPGEPPLAAVRSYHPAHNLGHFRFLECTDVTDGGQPCGDILHWDEIRFPFTPQLAQRKDLAAVPVHHDALAAQQEIAEAFACDASGTVNVTLANKTAGYSRSFPLGHWGAQTAPIKPGRRKKKA